MDQHSIDTLLVDPHPYYINVAAMYVITPQDQLTLATHPRGMHPTMRPIGAEQTHVALNSF